MAQCVNLVAAHEARTGEQYASVLRVRPDLRLGALGGTLRDMRTVYVDSRFRDAVVFLPRAAADMFPRCIEKLRGPTCGAQALAMRNLTVGDLYARHDFQRLQRPTSDVFYTWEFRANERLLEAIVVDCLGFDYVVDHSIDVDILRLPLAGKLRGLKSAWIKAKRHGENSTVAREAFLRIRREVPLSELCSSMGFCGCTDTGASCID